jgi:hypothetical protein
MAAILAKLTKFAPGKVAGIPEFQKALSKLASYKHSSKYASVLEQLIKDGLIRHEEEVAEPVAPSAPPAPVEVAPVEAAPVVVPAETGAAEVPSPEPTVSETPVETVDPKVTTKKKR